MKMTAREYADKILHYACDKVHGECMKRALLDHDSVEYTAHNNVRQIFVTECLRASIEMLNERHSH